MTSKMLHLGTAAALLLARAALAEDPTTTQQPGAVRAAMHEAMQTQMAAPTSTPDMPGVGDHASTDAATAQQRATQMRQARDVAQQQAMTHAQNATSAHGGAAMSSGMQGGAGMNGDATTQGAGMMRTGDQHGGTGGMMPSSGGMMSGTSSGTSTTTGTSTGTTGGSGTGGMMH